MSHNPGPFSRAFRLLLLAAVAGGTASCDVLLPSGSDQAIPTEPASDPVQPRPEPDDPNLCPERFRVEAGGEELALPYCASAPLDEPDPWIERVVFSVHGINTNADDYFGWMIAAAERIPGQMDRTLVIAPQLMTRSDASNWRIRSTDVFWRTSSGRFWGADSDSTGDNPRGARISAYEILDRLLAELLDPDLFPNLETIVVAGHSGGGQFTNRYAVANVFDDEDVEARGVRIRYVVSNPSSYVYLSGERRVSDVGLEFDVPSTASGSCPSYNRYGYGMEGLAAYPYLEEVGANRMSEQYRDREVVYLMGGSDNDPNAPALARGCAAMHQGAHRLERGEIYYHYLVHLYGEAATDRHSLAVVPGIGHSARAMWASDVGVREIFEYDGNLLEGG